MNKYLKPVVDVQFDVPESIKKQLMENCSGQNTYYKLILCEHSTKHRSRIKNPENVIWYDEEEKANPNAYIYEKGDSEVVDWFLANGFNYKDEIIVLTWW
jgi:hypothetical protein